jgi:CheY-like chemotaxis protein
VLVVDDNADAAEMLASLVRDLGHEVRVAHDGASALVTAESLRPDVVFLDIGLPGMDGYDVAQALRERRLDARLVAVTGYGRPGDRQRALDSGFAAHLTKPARPELVAQALSSEDGRS